nr:cell division cycle 48C [Tanacetum cinerariifolium]
MSSLVMAMLVTVGTPLWVQAITPSSLVTAIKYSKHKKNVECEIVNNSAKKLDLMKKNRSVTNTLAKSSPKKPDSLLNDGSEVNGKGNEDGPRFKDLGGIDDVFG